MTLNTGYYLQAYTFITLILCGLVQYFTGMQSVLWIPFFLTLLMVGLMVMQTREPAASGCRGDHYSCAVFLFSAAGRGFNPAAGRGNRRDCGL